MPTFVNNVITKNNIARLNRNSKLLSLVDNSYLTDETNDNFKYIQKKFYPLEPLDKVKTLNTGTGMFERIANIKGSYVNTPDYDITIDIEKITRDFVTLGHACLGVGYEGNKPFVYRLPSEGYFRQNGQHNIMRVYDFVNENDETEYYAYIQTFYDTYTENRLYKSYTKYILDYDYLYEVTLDSIPETAMMEERKDHVFGQPSMILILDDEVDIYPEYSEISKIKDHVYSMDRKKVMFDVEFLKNVDSFVLFRDIHFTGDLQEKREKGLKLEMADFGRYIDAGHNGSIEFVNNTNSLIKDAMEQAQRDVNTLSAMTSIPLDYLGVETSHGIGQNSRSMLHGSFVKDIIRIRHIRDKYIPKVIEMMQMIDSTLGDSYSRPEIFAKDDNQLLEEMTQAKNNDMLSHIKALMKYNQYTMEEAEEEFELILDEKKRTMLVQQATKSLLGTDGNDTENAQSDGSVERNDGTIEIET